jgi:hypothetical protein
MAPAMPMQATPAATPPAMAPPFVFFLVDEVGAPVEVGWYREVLPVGPPTRVEVGCPMGWPGYLGGV